MIDLLEGLRILSMIIGAGFGAFGIAAEFRDPITRKVTRAGKVALGGITLSLFVSLGLVWLEAGRARDHAIRAAAEAEATTRRLREVLEVAQMTAATQDTSLRKSEEMMRKSEEMNRDLAVVLDQQAAAVREIEGLSGRMSVSLNQQSTLLAQSSDVLKKTERSFRPLGSPTVSLWIDIPANHPAFAAYTNRIRPHLCGPNGGVALMAEDVLPNPELPGEAAAYEAVFGAREFLVSLYAARGNKANTGDRAPDLTFAVRVAPSIEDGDLRGLSWNYDGDGGFYRYFVVEAPVEVTLQSEAMTSMLDVPGSRIRVYIPNDRGLEIWGENSGMLLFSASRRCLYTGPITFLDDGWNQTEFWGTIPDTCQWWPPQPYTSFDTGGPMLMSPK